MVLITRIILCTARESEPVSSTEEEIKGGRNEIYSIYIVYFARYTRNIPKQNVHKKSPFQMSFNQITFLSLLLAIHWFGTY